MKKNAFIYVFILLLIIQSAVSAQDLLISGNNSLPVLQSGLPDPGVSAGSIGSLYQTDFQYYDTLYNAYLYPQPESALSFIADYTTAAGNAGFIATTDLVDGYNALRISTPTDPDHAALLFYEYQGYMLFMVPTNMEFALEGEKDELTNPASLVDQGYAAIQSGDYERAVRYLIRAAGAYIRGTGTEAEIIQNPAVVPTETPKPGLPSTYIVQDGDTCWGIAVDRFGVNFELFMQVNGMTDCNIGIGDEVIIPGADQTVATSTPIPLDQYNAGEIVSYTVEMNDSYNDIAAKFNSTIESIQRLNNVNVYTSFPQYGQVLRIEVNLITPTPSPEPSTTPEVGTLQP